MRLTPSILTQTEIRIIFISEHSLSQDYAYHVQPPPPPLLPPRQAKVNCTLDLDVFLSQLLLFKSF